MLGGGTYITQNKTLPGSYINFVNASKVYSTVGERGIVAIALPLGKAVGTVIKVEKVDFIQNGKELLGFTYDADEVVALREIFRHANTAYVYDLGVDSAKTVGDMVKAIEPYEFNVLCAYTGVAEDANAYITAVKTWREDIGKKCQVVVYNATSPDHEGVINLVTEPSDESAPDYALTAWLAGAEAGCAINQSCTNMLYDGEYAVAATMTQTELSEAIKAGKVAFHLVYNEVRLLEDINSLVTTTDDKGEDFKSNQTIRVIDQIATDIAKIFNTKYLGKIPNNAAGRTSFWGDIIAHHRELEKLEAIENFDSAVVTVEQGANKKSIIVTDSVCVVNAMAQLYMTVVVE